MGKVGIVEKQAGQGLATPVLIQHFCQGGDVVNRLKKASSISCRILDVGFFIDLMLVVRYLIIFLPLNLLILTT